MRSIFSLRLVFAILSASLGITTLAGQAAAQVFTLFTDRGAFIGAIGAPFVEGFNTTPAVAETALINTTTFAVTPTSGQFRVDAIPGSDGNAVLLRSTGNPALASEVLVTPTAPVRGFGFDYVLGEDGTAFVFVTANTAGGPGPGIPTFSFTGVAGDIGFAGFVTANPDVTSVEITNVGGGTIAVDNVTLLATDVAASAGAVAIAAPETAPTNLASIGNLAKVGVEALISAPAHRGNAYAPNACAPLRVEDRETADASPRVLAALKPALDGGDAGRLLAQATDDPGDAACVPLFGSQELSGWVDGGYLSGNFASRDAQSGGDYDGYAITGGVDYRLRRLGLPGLVGLAGGFSSVQSDLDDGGETETRLGSVVAYYQFESTPGFYVNAAVGHATGAAELTRQATDSAFTARAEPDLDAWMGNILLGWDEQQDNLVFGPFINWTYGEIGVDSYAETNQGDIRLDVERQTVRTNGTQLGARLQYTYQDEDMTVVPQLRLAYENNVGEDGRDVDYTVLASGAPGRVPVPDSQGSALRLGATLTADFENQYTLTFAYDGRLANQDSTSHAFTANLRVRF